MAKSTTDTINLVVAHVADDASIIEVTCTHSMELIEMHSSQKKKNIMLDVHALPGEMCMSVHARKDYYTSTLDIFSSVEPMEISRRTCLHEQGVLINYYFHQARPPEKLAYSWMSPGIRDLLSLKGTG